MGTGFAKYIEIALDTIIIDKYSILTVLTAGIVSFFGFMFYKFTRYDLLKSKTHEIGYVRKMFDDLNSNNRSFLFSVQKYIGMKLSKEEIVFILNNNFYFLSKTIKHAYSKMIFKDNSYMLKHPVLGFMWAVVFYISTVFPTLLYIVFIMDIKNMVSPKTFLLFNAQVLPFFVFLSVVSIVNLNMFGTAERICNIKTGTNRA